MMLVPTTSEVALSVAVATRDAIGVGLLAGDDLTGTSVGDWLGVGVIWLREAVSDVGSGLHEATGEEATGDEATGDEATGEETTPLLADPVGYPLQVALPEV